jgi:lysophospholipase L1-like esterase
MTAQQKSSIKVTLGAKQRIKTLVSIALLSLAVAVAPAISASELHTSCSAKKQHWVGTWSASPLPADASFSDPNVGFENQTIRQIVRLSIGGKQVRVRLSNAYNVTPLTIGAAHVAIRGEEDSILPESDRTLTFLGEPFITIPPGGLAVSDPVDLEVAACADLAVSIYVPENTGPATWHEMGQQTTYISETGNYTDDTTIPVLSTDLSRYWLSGIEVTARRRMVSMVAFGDSITDGWGSTPDTNQRWPDILSGYLNCNPDQPPYGHRHRYGRLGILNQGVSGNRILYDIMGPNASARFDQDVLAQTGVDQVFIMIGINDIGIPGAFGIPDQEVTEDDIISGLSQLVTRARAQGLRVYGGTLTPFEGTTFPGYYSEAGEYKRVAVNEWIRTSGAFDVVVDFDAVLRDPEQPTRLLPEFDSGDHLHPSDAGYNAMADAVISALFER